MSETSFAEFMKTILEGIGYGNLSHTNRAYQWMKNSNITDGLCVNYLMNNITCDNFVTQREMNLFRELLNNENVPSENEIDVVLGQYFDKSPTVSENYSIDSLENELKLVDDYQKELELEEKLLLRQFNKLVGEVKALEKRNRNDENKLKETLNQTENINFLYNEITKEVQHNLSRINLIFTKLLAENVSTDRHNIFLINFETFKDINITFRESVAAVVKKQFGKNLKLQQCSNIIEETSILEFCHAVQDCYSVEEWKNKIHHLIMVISRLGKLNYQFSKYECEVLELQELNSYIENVITDVDANNISVTRFKSQFAVNLEIIDDIQKKILVLSENLERYCSSSMLHDTITKERIRIEHKLKTDRKCLHKIADVCNRFVDLMTLQTCLLQSEKENIDLATVLYENGLNMLEEQYKKHSDTMNNLRQMLENQNALDLSRNKTIGSLTDWSPATINSTDSCDLVGTINSNLHFPSDTHSKIVTIVDQKLDEFIAFKTQLQILHNSMFDGPLNQAFFCGTIFNSKTQLDLQCSEFFTKFNTWKLQYNTELEKFSDEYLKMKKMLGFTFLTDPAKLRNDMKMLRNQLSDLSKSTTFNLKSETTRSGQNKKNLTSY